MAQKKTASKAKKGSPEILSTNVAETAATLRSELNDEEIARRAYLLWENRGRPLGSPDEDWHKATEELRAGA